MLKQCIKNYLKCLKYVFTPLGIIALGFVCGLSIAIPAAINSVKDMCAEIVEISNQSIDFSVLIRDFVKSVQALDWSDIWGSLNTLFTKEWWVETFKADINAIIGDIESFIQQIIAAVDACIADLFRYAVLVFSFVTVAFIAAYFLTKWLIRRDIAKRNLWKFIISTFLGAVISATAAAFTVYLAAIWAKSIFITVVIAFILASILSLISAYLIHGFKKVPFHKIVNWKNIAMLLLSDLIIFGMAVAIVIIVTLILNLVVGIFVAVGLVCVTVAVLAMNAESYVKATAERARDGALIHTTTATDTSGDRPKDGDVKHADSVIYPYNEVYIKADTASESAAANASDKSEKPDANS